MLLAPLHAECPISHCLIHVLSRNFLVQVSTSTNPGGRKEVNEKAPPSQISGAHPGAVESGPASSDNESELKHESATVLPLDTHNTVGVLQQQLAGLELENGELEALVHELRVELSTVQVQANSACQQLSQYEGGGSPKMTRMQLEDELEALRMYNDVMATRLENFQQQLGEARDEMSDEMKTMLADHSVLQEEYTLVKTAEESLRAETDSLRGKLHCERSDKDDKLAAAKVATLCKNLLT